MTDPRVRPIASERPPAGAKPIAGLSFDLDNLWSYLKTHGDPGWERRPTYLPTLVPEVLERLEAHRLTITFFVVGVDARVDVNVQPLRSLADAGHEIGNHSYEHEPWLHLYDRDRLSEEITRAEDAIVDATGQRPIGFRGPGYSWSDALLTLLADRGYMYDSSTLPTYIGPLARAYYFRTARLHGDEREMRAMLFGRFSDGRRPVKPYEWCLADGRTLLELPVTTFPLFRVPIHLSYLLYLGRVSERLMIAYLRAAAVACLRGGVRLNFLLHPLDFIGGDREPRLAFFPGMDLSTARKAELFDRVVRVLMEYFRLVDLRTYARSLGAQPATPVSRDAIPAAHPRAGARV